MAEEKKKLDMNDAYRKLETIIPEVADSIILSNNAIYNREQSVTLKSLTGALMDIGEYRAKKYGRKSKEEA